MSELGKGSGGGKFSRPWSIALRRSECANSPASGAVLWRQAALARVCVIVFYTSFGVFNPPLWCAVLCCLNIAEYLRDGSHFLRPIFSDCLKLRLERPAAHIPIHPRIPTGITMVLSCRDRLQHQFTGWESASGITYW